MSFVYTPAKTALLNGDFDFAADDIRIILVMTNTTADTEQDAQFVGSLTTLDEMDNNGGNSRQALASEAVNEDAANNRAEFDATDAVFTNLVAGTRNVAGIVLYKHVTNDADSPLIAYIDDGFPYTANGATLTIQWNAEGILQAT